MTSKTQFNKKLELALQLDFGYVDRVQRDLPVEIPTSTLTSTSTDSPIESNVQHVALVPAAVLLLFAFDRQGQPNLLYIQRSNASEDVHRGQMAFPGGRAKGGENPWETALRETEEEVGIPPGQIQKIGQLPDLLTVTGFLVRPMVAVHGRPLEDIGLKMDQQEIFATTWISLATLLEPATYTLEMYPVRGKAYPIHVYTVPPYRIWGATGSMTKNLLDRWLAIG